MISDAGARKFLSDLACGGGAAAISKTAVAPFERVKLLLQTQHSLAAIDANKRYKGIIDILVRVPKEQGLSSLWRGNVVNVVRYFPMQALNFAFKDAYKRIFFPRIDGKKDKLKFLTGNLLSGGAAGSTSIALLYPLDFARTRLALDVGKGNNREFKGLFDCLSKILRCDGLRGIYRGLMLSMCTSFMYRGTYFGLFDTLKSFVAPSGNLNFFATWGLAQGVTVCAVVVPYPFDTVRRRLMIQSGKNNNVSYNSSLDCFKRILKSEGPLAFYNGFFSNALRGTGAALVLVIYDQTRNYLN